MNAMKLIILAVMWTTCSSQPFQSSLDDTHKDHVVHSYNKAPDFVLSNETHVFVNGQLHPITDVFYLNPESENDISATLLESVNSTDEEYSNTFISTDPKMQSSDQESKKYQYVDHREIREMPQTNVEETMEKSHYAGNEITVHPSFLGVTDTINNNQTFLKNTVLSTSLPLPPTDKNKNKSLVVADEFHTTVQTSMSQLTTDTPLTLFYHDFDDKIHDIKPTKTSLSSQVLFTRFETSALVDNNNTNLEPSPMSEFVHQPSTSKVTKPRFIDATELDDKQKMLLAIQETRHLAHPVISPIVQETTKYNITQLFTRLQRLRQNKKNDRDRTARISYTSGSRGLNKVPGESLLSIQPSFASSENFTIMSLPPCGPAVTRTVIRTLLVDEVCSTITFTCLRKYI